MILWLFTFALASYAAPAPKAPEPAPLHPPASAFTAPCALQGAPRAELSWTLAGDIWLTTAGETLTQVHVDEPLPSAAHPPACEGTRISFLTDRGTHGTLALSRVRIDFDEVLENTPLALRDPEAAAQASVKAAVEAGDLTALSAAVAPGDSHTRDAALAATLSAAEAALSRGDATLAAELGRTLALQDGLTPGLLLSASLLEARATLALGASAEAIALLQPLGAPGSALLGEAHWAAGDKRSATAAWLAAMDAGQPLTDDALARCKPCRKR